MNKKVKMILKILGIIISILVLVVGGYLIYLIADFSRIEDNKDVEVGQGATFDEKVPVSEELKIISYNIGFGAYSRDFSFFMDGGKYSRAIDKQHVLDATNGVIDVLENQDADFVHLQEVDTDGDRSYHVNQQSMIETALSNYDEAFVCNYHSSYLFYPLTKPIGKATSGISVFSKYDMESCLRRSFPISKDIPDKIIDLDRCYSISKIPTSNGKYLVLFNLHMSAYTSDDTIRTNQIKMLCEDMKKAYDEGNYVICGGDFNHDMLGNSDEIYDNKNTGFNWTHEFPKEYMAKEFMFVLDTLSDSEREDLVPSCRNTDKPYKEGDNEVWILDSFIVSDNITINSFNTVDTDFEFSDHNPVMMTFTLNE